jgi:beta-mannosidase
MRPPYAEPYAEPYAQPYAADELLAWTWKASSGEASGEVWAPLPWKSYDLHPAGIKTKITADGKRWNISVSAEKPAFFVALEADRPGHFSQNAFTLFPGYDANISFTPETSGNKPGITVRDLHSATYGRPL